MGVDGRATPKLVVFQSAEVASTFTYMREVTAVQQEWLIEAAPHFYNLRGGRER